MTAPDSSARGRPRATARDVVVDLSRAREARRLLDFQARCRSVDDVNRKVLASLFQSGLIFTRHGARLGRELLLAHQHILRVSDLLARIADLPAGEPGDDATPLYAEAQALLARTTELTARCNVALARQR